MNTKENKTKKSLGSIKSFTQDYIDIKMPTSLKKDYTQKIC